MFKIITRWIFNISLIFGLIGCGGGSSNSDTGDESSEIVDRSDNMSRESSVPTPPNKKWLNPTESICNNGGGVMNVNGMCLANWENAKKICRASGGVLPTIEMLEKVVTDCGAIIDDVYENSENSDYQACYRREGFFSSPSYWSSTTHESQYVNNDLFALIIYFDDGDESDSVKTFDYDNGLRCARL